MLGRPFEVTDDSLEQLRDYGLDSNTLTALEKLKNSTFKHGEELLAALAPARPPGRKQAKLILKLTRRSLLRLETLIPNRSLREWVEALVYAVLLAVIVRTFIFAPFKIPSGSMEPTIQIGDHIFATNYSYGIRVPFFEKKLFPQKIERGDIIIFPYPVKPEVDYIKRVVAVGGDTISVKGDRVYIDGVLQDEPFAYHDPSRGAPEDFPPTKVPPGKLFMMGDNRRNSADSRVWGFLEAATVRGKGRIVYVWSDPNKHFLNPTGYSFRRTGTILR